MKNSLEDRFWEKVNKCGPTPEHVSGLGPCWIWTGTKDRNGYGQTSYADPIGDWRKLFTHRVGWFLANGQIPEGVRVLHKCDNPICCNPDHLFLGTQLDNIADMQKKGRNRGLRHAVGEGNNSAKLTEDGVRDIRSRAENGEKLYEIAFSYGMTRQAIANCVFRRTWKHVA